MLLSIICCLLIAKIVIDAIKCCFSDLWRHFSPAGLEKGIKYIQDQSSIMLLFKHNFRHNAVVFKGGAAKPHSAQIFEHNVFNFNSLTCLRSVITLVCLY